jgi:hypothetical protein
MAKAKKVFSCSDYGYQLPLNLTVMIFYFFFRFQEGKQDFLQPVSGHFSLEYAMSMKMYYQRETYPQAA